MKLLSIALWLGLAANLMIFFMYFPPFKNFENNTSQPSTLYPSPGLDAGLSDEQWEFLKDVSKLIQYANENGYKLTGGELYRTMYQQRYYVANGLSWTYNSYHLKRLAIDLNLFVDGKYTTKCKDYEPLGEYWESLNPKNKWGGSWHSKDCPHLERRN